jgi:hypothetical protein
VTKHAQSLEVIGVGPILEFDADEVPLVRSGTSTDFNGESGSIIGQTLELGVVLRDLGHVEERNDRLVGSLDEQDLEGITVEGDALQSHEHGIHGGATSDCKAVNQRLVRKVGMLKTYCYRFRPCLCQRRSCPRGSQLTLGPG